MGRKLRRHFLSLDERMAEIESDIRRIEEAGREYLVLQAYKSGGDATSLDGMVPFIEGVLNSINLRDKITSMTPRDTVIDGNYTKRQVSIALREVSAAQFLDFIKQIEQHTGSLYKIESFSSRPVLKKNGLYNVSITVVGFQKKG